MPNINLTRDQLIDHLEENLTFLKLSSNSFDAGFTSEAKRLAVTIRVLLHDTRNSKSLLNQLGVKDSMEFYDTANPFDPNNIAAHNGLVLVRLGSGQINFKAPLEESVELGRPNNYVSFSNWWNQIVISDNANIKYTRSDLVKLLANKDGGAHVDPNIESDYAALKDTNRMVWQYVKEENGVQTHTDIKGVELHSIRQITFELIKSLENLDLAHSTK